MKWVLIVLVALAALVAITWVAGMLMPREHSATSRITLKASPDSVFAVLRDLGAVPTWNKATKSSERVTGAVPERWRQEAGGQVMLLDVLEATAPNRMVVKIVEDERSTFGGVWTYALEAAPGGGTVVRITEDGWIGPPPFRVIMSLMGANRTMDDVLTSLGARFGQTVTPEHGG